MFSREACGGVQRGCQRGWALNRLWCAWQCDWNRCPGTRWICLAGSIAVSRVSRNAVNVAAVLRSIGSVSTWRSRQPRGRREPAGSCARRDRCGDGPAGTRRRAAPGNDIGHPADVPKAASQSGSHYAIQTNHPRRAAAGSVPRHDPGERGASRHGARAACHDHSAAVDRRLFQPCLRRAAADLAGARYPKGSS